MDVLYVCLVAACIAPGAVAGIWRLFAITPSRQLEIAFFSSGVALSIVATGSLFSPFHIPYLSLRATNHVEPENGPVARLTQGAGGLRASPKEVAPENNIQALFRSVRGLDRWTAVYDIAAHTVYLPNGRKLEAHSGLGSRLDNPRYVHERMRGATPPNAYELALREKPFHGVRALRLNPVGNGDLFGRSGLLAHTYMLGANGDSNGCVVFKDYDAFLGAFETGEVRRLVVVSHLESL